MWTNRRFENWLIYCADATGTALPMPRPLLTARAEEKLVEQADRHGVLPALLRRFPFSEARSAELRTNANDRNRGNQIFSTILRHHGDLVMSDAAGLPASIIKGPVFARTIYPHAFLRGYTDIDILAAPEAVEKLGSILDAHGFEPARSDTEPHGEWKWLNRVNAAIMIEVQIDLVHTPMIRDVVSLPYEVIAGAPESPAALLLIALIHAGAGDQFERLQPLVDICLAAEGLSGIEQESRFEAMVGKTGARLACVSGLELAGGLFSRPRCLEIATALKPTRHSAIARRLLQREAVTSAMSKRRAFHSWRRKAVRELLKRS